MKKEDLLRYIQNKGDEDFQQQVVDWITSSPENENFYHKVKAMYVAEFNVQEKLNTEEAFNKFKFQIKKQRFPYARIAGNINSCRIGYWPVFYIQSGFSKDTI